MESAHVPFGILGDFEGHMPFVEHIIDQLVGTPRLYALIGNTFGNLDLGEETFLGDLDPSLAKKCVLLLHVSVLGDSWTWETDPRANAQTINTGYLRLFANAIAPIIRDSDSAHLDLELGRTRLNITQGSSDVPNSITIKYSDRQTNRTLYNIRRYNFEALIEWIETRLRLKVIFKGKTNVKGILQNGVILVTHER